VRRALLFVALLAAPAWAGPADDQVARSVVQVRAPKAWGSGFVVHAQGDEVLVVTNKHVCPSDPGKCEVYTAVGGETFAAAWVAADPDADLALLRVKAKLPALGLADAEPDAGARVVMWGMKGGFRYGAFDGPTGDGATNQWGKVGSTSGFAFTPVPGDSGAPVTADGKRGPVLPRPPGRRQGKKVAALAPWLPAAEAAELVAPARAPPRSSGPTGGSAGRRSSSGARARATTTGSVKDLKDVRRPDRLRPEEGQQVRREVAAIVARSGVANFPRQVFREQALTGGRWETRDQIADNKDERNALRQLDWRTTSRGVRDLRVPAQRPVLLLPGRRPGERQDSAPDGIGPDKTAPGNDGKIHVGLSCVRCHVEGLRRSERLGPAGVPGPQP
jgi:hypothetical protein